MKVVLDTHILIFWVNDDETLSAKQSQILNGASADNPLFISDISLWEISTLYSLRRISLDRPLRDWLERAASPPLVQRVGISPAIASEIAVMPDSFHRDPADRILVATAVVLGATLMTNDLRIRESGLVPTV
jgi:PIN domain nuclease of toxin-antitoxin system